MDNSISYLEFSKQTLFIAKKTFAGHHVTEPNLNHIRVILHLSLNLDDISYIITSPNLEGLCPYFTLLHCKYHHQHHHGNFDHHHCGEGDEAEVGS